MKECLGSIRRMMGLNTSVNTESKDQKMIKILSDINKNITLLNGRIVALEDDKIQSRDRIIVLEDDKTQSKDRIIVLEDRIILLEDDKIQLRDRIIVLEDENVLYKDQLNVVEENIKMLNDVCLEPIIRNVAVQIMYHFFPVKIFSSSGKFTKASSKNANIPILNIVMGQLNCKPADIDALINIRNRDSHLNIVDLKEKVDYVRIIIGNSPKFSDDLGLPLDIIANYELFVSHFGNLKI
jgi:hypothetical protein